MNVNFHACKNGNWCYQKGTKGQYTRCESVSSDGLTCYNPEIKCMDANVLHTVWSM